MSRRKVFFYILLLIMACAVQPLCAQQNTLLITLPDGKQVWYDSIGCLYKVGTPGGQESELALNGDFEYVVDINYAPPPVPPGASQFVVKTSEGFQVFDSNGERILGPYTNNNFPGVSQSRVIALSTPGHFAVVTSQGLYFLSTNPQQPAPWSFYISGINTASVYSVLVSGMPGFIVIPLTINAFYVYNISTGNLVGPILCPSGQIANFTQLPNGLCVITTRNGPTYIHNPNVHPPAFISISNQNTAITNVFALSNGQYAVVTGNTIQIFPAGNCTIQLTQNITNVYQLANGNLVVQTANGLSIFTPTGNPVTALNPQLQSVTHVVPLPNGNFIVVGQMPDEEDGQTLNIYGPNGTRIIGPIQQGANATLVVALPQTGLGHFVFVAGQPSQLYFCDSTTIPPVVNPIGNCIKGGISDVIQLSDNSVVVVTDEGVYVVGLTDDTCYSLKLDLDDEETPFAALLAGNSIVVVTSRGRILGFNPSNTSGSNRSLRPSGTQQLPSQRVNLPTRGPNPNSTTTPIRVIPDPGVGIIVDTEDGMRWQVPIEEDGEPGIPDLVYSIQPLSGLWRFEQGSGDTAVDSSGLGCDGTLVDGAAFDSDLQRGSVMSFDGTGWIDVGAAVAEMGNADFSIVAWINTTQSGGVIVSKQDGDDQWERGEKILYITPENDGSLAFEGVLAMGGSGHGWIASNEPVVTDGQWHHIAVTFQLDLVGNNPGVIYVDGIPVTGYAEPYGQNYNTFGIFGDNPDDTVYIGCTSNYITTTNFEGLLDDVAIFACVLTEQEIVTIMGGDFSGYDGPEMPPPFEIRNISGDTVIGSHVVSGWDDIGDTGDEITGQFVLSGETDIASAVVVVTANESVMLTTEGGDEKLLDPKTITFGLELAGEVPLSIESGQLRYQGIVSTDSDTYVLELFVGELPAYAVLYDVQESALVFQEYVMGGLLDIDPFVDGNEGVWISAPRQALEGLSDEVEVLITTINVQFDADGGILQTITDDWPDDGFTILEVPSDEEVPAEEVREIITPAGVEDELEEQREVVYGTGNEAHNERGGLVGLYGDSVPGKDDDDPDTPAASPKTGIPGNQPGGGARVGGPNIVTVPVVPEDSGFEVYGHYHVHWDSDASHPSYPSVDDIINLVRNTNYVLRAFVVTSADVFLIWADRTLSAEEAEQLEMEIKREGNTWEDIFEALKRRGIVIYKKVSSDAAGQGHYLPWDGTMPSGS